jgi:acetolactate synthase small subunit
MTSAEANSAAAPRHAPEKAAPVACFSVLTEADPSAVPRVLEVFALRDLIPSQIHVTRSGGDNMRAPEAEITIDVQVSGVGRAASESIARKLRAIICVHSVLTSERQPRDAP